MCGVWTKIMKKRFRLGCLVILLAIVGGVAFPFVWNEWVEWRYGREIYGVEEVREERVAIVFGARIYGDGRLSAMLRDRMDTAIELYEMGKVERLLLSGDNSSETYDEPSDMMAYALAQGVPAEAIQPDYGGRRTYDTCYRARDVFELESAILVTQAFHLPRALFTCGNLGVDVVGVVADRSNYRASSLSYSENREFLATVLAFYDVLREEPAPVLGEPIPIQ